MTSLPPTQRTGSPSQPNTIKASLWNNGGKRAFDLLVSTLLIVAGSPLILLLALMVKITGPGPMIFTQPRIGRGGRVFTLYKFRTMRAGRQSDHVELVPLTHPEITECGRFLRRFKLDELPQLANVIRGDMSLVGPRPTLPEHVAAYDEFRRQRLLVRPGMTGLAQVFGNTSIPWDERILFDIAYARRCGLTLDLKILLRTAHVIVRGEPRNPPRFSETPFAAFVDPPQDYFSSDHADAHPH